jgi:hypothetical protein
VNATYLSWGRPGTGKPLLLHGIGSTRDDFDMLRPALEAEFDVLDRVRHRGPRCQQFRDVPTGRSPR